MASLKAIELKFLLKLLSFDDYRSKIGDVKPNSKTLVAESRRICDALVSKGYVECSREILEFVIGASGKTLLSKGAENLPIQPSPQEMKVLEAAQQKIRPSKLKSIPSSDRQDIIKNMAERGLLEIKKTAIKEVWLNTQGQQFLKEECEPTGSWSITATMLGSYLNFLRTSTSSPPAPQSSLPTGQPRSQQPLAQPGIQPSVVPIGSQAKPDKASLLSQIKQLDQRLGSDNFLPIFHLRDQLQPPLTRAEFDSMLYALQREGKIDLSSLHDQGKYSQAQMSAGILQDNGGYLFFISIL